MKRFSFMFSSEADATARVSVKETAPEAEASHKCSICGKSFDSGKALGGHRRSHFQASKKTLFSINYSKEGTSLNSKEGTSLNSKDHICYVCKKNFPTNKALYGHMRSHPDRVFKGISPPSNLSHEIENKKCSSNSQSSLSSSSMVHNKEDQEDGFVEPKGYSDIDLSKSPLPKWKKRDKRGKKCSESYEAAITLMQLSGNTKYLCSAVSINKFEPPKSFAELVSMKKKRELGESTSGKEHSIKKIRFVFGGSMKWELGESSSSGKEHPIKKI